MSDCRTCDAHVVQNVQLQAQLDAALADVRMTTPALGRLAKDLTAMTVERDKLRTKLPEGMEDVASLNELHEQINGLVNGRDYYKECYEQACRFIASACGHLGIDPAANPPDGWTLIEAAQKFSIERNALYERLERTQELLAESDAKWQKLDHIIGCDVVAERDALALALKEADWLIGCATHDDTDEYTDWYARREAWFMARGKK